MMAMARMPKVTGKAKKVRGVAKKRQSGPYMPKVKGKAKKVKGRAMRGTMGPVRSM